VVLLGSVLLLGVRTRTLLFVVPPEGRSTAYLPWPPKDVVRIDPRKPDWVAFARSVANPGRSDPRFEVEVAGQRHRAQLEPRASGEVWLVTVPEWHPIGFSSALELAASSPWHVLRGDCMLKSEVDNCVYGPPVLERRSWESLVESLEWGPGSANPHLWLFGTLVVLFWPAFLVLFGGDALGLALYARRHPPSPCEDGRNPIAGRVERLRALLRATTVVYIAALASVLALHARHPVPALLVGLDDWFLLLGLFVVWSLARRLCGRGAAVGFALGALVPYVKLGVFCYFLLAARNYRRQLE
jgi:hypothetical protein